MQTLMETTSNCPESLIEIFATVYLFIYLFFFFSENQIVAIHCKIGKTSRVNISFRRDASRSLSLFILYFKFLHVHHKESVWKGGKYLSKRTFHSVVLSSTVSECYTLTKVVIKFFFFF